MRPAVTPWLSWLLYAVCSFPFVFSVCCTFTVSSQPHFRRAVPPPRERFSHRKGEAHGIRNTAVARRYGSRHPGTIGVSPNAGCDPLLQTRPAHRAHQYVGARSEAEQITIRKEQFALRRDGATLFGVLLLGIRIRRMACGFGPAYVQQRTMSIHFARDYRCLSANNMVFRGDLIALNRKHTPASPENGDHHAYCGFRTFRQAHRRDRNLKRSGRSRTRRPKPLCMMSSPRHSAIRLLPDASNLYFEPLSTSLSRALPWSLHNAFTSVAKEMPITTRMPAIQELGKYFGMSNHVIESGEA